MLVVSSRSDKFPVGTSVGAYATSGPYGNRHHEGKPSGTAAATATVAANGTLTFTTLAEGIWSLYAEVGGAPANMLAGNQEFPPLGTLKERIAARRALVGA